MSSKYKESTARSEVLHGENYKVLERKIKKNQKDFTNLVLGDYKVIEPIYIDSYESFRYSEGWLCLNTKTKTYKIIPNLSLNKMYIQYCSDSSYFGMEYRSADYPSKRINLVSFETEFLIEAEKQRNKYHDSFWEEEYKKYTKDVKKYVENVNINLKTFKKLDNKLFNDELHRIVSKYNFKEIKDVSSYKNCLYLIVLDKYNQFYIGKAETSLKNRMRKHWTAKVIPGRHLWNGGFAHSRIKFDDFKIFDTTRIFVLENIASLLKENKIEASDSRLEIANTFGIEKYSQMSDLSKAERIVINNCRCIYCLSDRTPLMDYERYIKLEKIYKISKQDLLIKNYLRLDAKDPYKAMREN